MLRIGLVGLMKSGKGVVSRYLEYQYGFATDAFADPVKRASVAAINAALVEMGEEPFMTREILERDKTALRGMPQWIGTELGRVYLKRPTIWIDKLIGRYPRHQNFVVDDCRFLNEAAALREQNFLIFGVDRDEESRREAVFNDLLDRNPEWTYGRAEEETEKMMRHGSEAEVPLIAKDATLYNVTTIEDLTAQVDNLIGDLQNFGQDWKRTLPLARV